MAFGQPFLKQGFDADEVLGVLAHVFIYRVDAVAVGVDLDADLANVAFDSADANREPTEPGEGGSNRD